MPISTPTTGEPSVEGFLEPRSVAAVLGISYETTMRWIREGSLPAYRFGKQFRVSSDDLDQFIDDSKHDPILGDTE